MFICSIYVYCFKKVSFFCVFLLQFTTCKDTKKKRDSTNFILFNVHINLILVVKTAISTT